MKSMRTLHVPQRETGSSQAEWRPIDIHHRLLTERDPDSWVRSMNNTVAQFEIGMNSFPMTVFRHFNDEIGSFATLGSLIYYRWSDGTKPGKGHNQEALRRNYVD